jgi:copper chaperone CopZ
MIVLALVGFMNVGQADAADKKNELTLSGVHLCCGGCEKGVAAAVEDVEGVEVACDKDAGTVTIKASGRESGMAALKAIAMAGYHGKPSNSKIKMPVAKNVPEGMVSSLKLKGVHNCCGACIKAINKAVGSVKGAKAGEIAKKSRVFEVSGNFNAMQLVKAFNKAGMHVQVVK